MDFEVVEIMAGLKRADQLFLRKRFLELRDWPTRYSDYHEPDEVGRPIDIHICGKYAVKYWEDFADRQVKILDVHLADQQPRR